MGIDPRLRPYEDGWFTDTDYPPIVEEARDFAESVYFRDLCDIYEEVSYRNSIGASQGVVDHIRSRSIPIHIRRINAAYAGDVTENSFDRGEDVSYSMNVSELCFPLDIPLEVGDKIKLHATENHPVAWFTLTSVDDYSTDALMIVTRGARIGVPDGIPDE